MRKLSDITIKGLRLARFQQSRIYGQADYLPPEIVCGIISSGFKRKVVKEKWAIPTFLYLMKSNIRDICLFWSGGS